LGILADSGQVHPRRTNRLFDSLLVKLTRICPLNLLVNQLILEAPPRMSRICGITGTREFQAPPTVQMHRDERGRPSV
jgi:hypothetical protein